MRKSHGAGRVSSKLSSTLFCIAPCVVPRPGFERVRVLKNDILGKQKEANQFFIQKTTQAKQTLHPSSSYPLIHWRWPRRNNWRGSRNYATQIRFGSVPSYTVRGGPGEEFVPRDLERISIHVSCAGVAEDSIRWSKR